MEWHRAIGHGVGSVHANSFNFGLAASLTLKASEHIQHKFRGGTAFLFCCHLLHIPIFFCSPAPALNNSKRQRTEQQTRTAESKTSAGKTLLTTVENKNVTFERGKKEWGTACVQAETLSLANEVTTVAVAKKKNFFSSINKEELLSHATLIWLAWHFHYMLMNYGWWELLSPSECNWTFISQLLTGQAVGDIKGSCCYFGDESKQAQNLELIEKRIHVDK